MDTVFQRKNYKGWLVEMDGIEKIPISRNMYSEATRRIPPPHTTARYYPNPSSRPSRQRNDCRFAIMDQSCARQGFREVHGNQRHHSHTIDKTGTVICERLRRSLGGNKWKIKVWSAQFQECGHILPVNLQNPFDGDPEQDPQHIQLCGTKTLLGAS